MYHATERQKRAFQILEQEMSPSSSFPSSFYSRKQALQYSIAKWECTLDAFESGILLTNTGGVSTCALCVRYEKSRCQYCPIKIKSGRRWCECTPYAYFEWEMGDGPTLEGAVAELEFLQEIYKELYEDEQESSVAANEET